MDVDASSSPSAGRTGAGSPAGDAIASHLAPDAGVAGGGSRTGYNLLHSWHAEGGVALTCARYAWDGSLIAAAGTL